MPEPIRQITTTAGKTPAIGYDPSALTEANILEELFGEGGAAPTEGMIADLIEELKDAAKVTDTPSEAIAKYKEALARYRITGNPEDKNQLDVATQTMADLGVTREQLEGAGLYGGIIEGPSFGEKVTTGIERLSELFGLAGEGLAGLVGADEALSAVLATLPVPGVTFVFGQKEGQPPFVTGQTPSGTQVGITDSYGITAILEGLRRGDFDFYDAAGVLGSGAAGAAGAAGAGGATAIAASVKDEDEEGVQTGVDVVRAGGEPVSDEADRVDELLGTDTLEILEPEPEIPSLEELEPRRQNRTMGYGGGGGGGGGSDGVDSSGLTQGIRGVSTEKAGVADIAILYDPSLSFAENMERMLGKTKKTDAVDSVLMYGGGAVHPTDLNNEILRILEGR